jgi:hypothetical protein
MATRSNSQISSIDDVDSSDAVAIATANDAVVVAGANHDDSLSGKMELLTISSANEDGGGDAVFVSHNGYAYQIPRDKPCKVPMEVAQGLRDARVMIYKPGPNGQLTQESRQRFAFFSQPI